MKMAICMYDCVPGMTRYDCERKLPEHVCFLPKKMTLMMSFSNVVLSFPIHATFPPGKFPYRQIRAHSELFVPAFVGTLEQTALFLDFQAVHKTSRLGGSALSPASVWPVFPQLFRVWRAGTPATAMARAGPTRMDFPRCTLSADSLWFCCIVPPSHLTGGEVVLFCFFFCDPEYVTHSFEHGRFKTTSLVGMKLMGNSKT